MPEYTDTELAAGAEAVLQWRVWPHTACGSGVDMSRVVLDAAAPPITVRVRAELAEEIAAACVATGEYNAHLFAAIARACRIPSPDSGTSPEATDG